MNFFDLINRRESCRNFSDRPVEKEKLIKCIEAARLAPSACNSQPWSFKAVNNKEMAAKLAPCLQDLGMNKFTDKCPAFIVITEEKATLSAKFGGILKSQHFAQMDIGIAATHICLAATELGLSTCILGWFKEDKIKSELNIPNTKRIRLVIAIGYAATQDIRDKKRKSFEEIAEFID